MQGWLKRGIGTVMHNKGAAGYVTGQRVGSAYT